MARKKKKNREPVTTHDVPWHPPVVAFRDGSMIREAFAQWWEPDCRSELYDFLRALAPLASPEGIDLAFPWKPVPGKTVKVRILLDYPLNEVRERVIEVSTKRFGEIFGAAHDLYQEVYLEDAIEWKKAGKKVPPRVGRVRISGTKIVAKMMNRARSRLIWGHDMTDLVFEFVNFDFSPEAREAYDAYCKAGRKKKAVLDFRSAYQTMKFNTKKHVICTVTFGIGS